VLTSPPPPLLPLRLPLSPFPSSPTLLLLLLLLLLLQLSDIKKSITKVPTAITDTSGGSKLLAHELFTNDVLYAEAALDMSGMPAHLLPLVPLFCRSLTQVGELSCILLNLM
jgi:Zn-dependent M16 (insulinase) family peptidase